MRISRFYIDKKNSFQNHFVVLSVECQTFEKRRIPNIFLQKNVSKNIKSIITTNTSITIDLYRYKRRPAVLIIQPTLIVTFFLHADIVNLLSYKKFFIHLHKCIELKNNEKKSHLHTLGTHGARYSIRCYGIYSYFKRMDRLCPSCRRT